MLLKNLAQAFGVSGHEKEIGEVIVNEVMQYSDKVMKDALGNIIAFKKGTGGDKKIMISAHMDEIGFSVTGYDDKGLIKVRAIGGISCHVSYMNRVRFENGVIGIVGCYDKIDKLDGNNIDKLFIDIGAKDKNDAMTKLSIGDTACYYGEYTELANNCVMSKALDDRIGCYIGIEALKKLTKPYHDVYFVFSVQEEVGLRGAIVAAERIKPDLGIALDVTTAFDTPNSSNGNSVIGGGAAIKMEDGSVLCDNELTGVLIQCAKDNNIKHQLEVLSAGGTDAGAINRAYQGVKSLGISIAERYLHSPNGMLSIDDTNNCIDLLHKFLEKELIFETETIYK